MAIDLSILIPTCNRVDDTLECLKRLGVAISSAPDFTCEVILGNDGSVDDSDRFVVKEFPAPLRISQGPQLGPAANRNHLAEQAMGDVVLFLDDDIKPDQNLISAYESAIRAHPEAGIFEGRVVSEARPRFAYEEVIENETGGHLWTANLAVRTDVFKRLGGFDTDFPFAAMEDTDFRYRSQAAGIRSVWCPDAIVSHPIVSRKGSLHSAKHRYSLLLFVSKYPQYLDIVKRDFSYKQCLRVVKHNLVRRSVFQPIDGYVNILHRIASVLMTRRFLLEPSKIPSELARLEAAMKIPARATKWKAGIAT